MRRYRPNYLRTRFKEEFAKSGAELVYYFGSQVRGKIGKMSDVDLTVLWDENEKMPMKKSAMLQGRIRKILSDDRIEIGPLNGQSLSFCYNVIKNGVCIFGNEEERVKYETYILNEYLDFSYLADEYNRLFNLP